MSAAIAGNSRYARARAEAEALPERADQQVTSSDRFAFSVFLALTVHAALILGVTFTDGDISPRITRSIDVTLSRHREKSPPKEADFVAPDNQTGSGNLDEVRDTTTTERAEFDDNVIRKILPPPSAPSTPEVHSPDAVEVVDSTAAAREARQDPQREPQPEQPKLPQRDYRLLDVSQEIATLQARLDRERQAYARKPRVRRLTSVSTRSTADAYYLNAWRRKIETIGNLNYPQEARRRHLFGSLKLLVAIRPDGSLARVQLLESSGHKVLDDAAINIVRLAAPFAPFPDELAAETDLLEIIRTWQFRRNSRFGS